MLSRFNTAWREDYRGKIRLCGGDAETSTADASMIKPRSWKSSTSRR
jgi:hypothetical protein